MSGGSFNYLCHRPPDELVAGAADDDLREMAAELDAFDHPAAERAALAVRGLLAECQVARENVEDRHRGLERVLHAVEWWRSCDWGEDQVRRALSRWSRERGISE